jgi:carboxyl-terminal processing protease
MPVKLIRGPKGTIVKLTVKRADGTTKVIAIKRDLVEIDETFAKSAIIKNADGPIGYIYLPEFYADFNHTSNRYCSKDIATEVKKLKEAGVTGIILDLRNNGGGSLGEYGRYGWIICRQRACGSGKKQSCCPFCATGNTCRWCYYIPGQ